MNHRLRAALAALLFVIAAAAGHASELARADLAIVGLSLEVDTARVNTAVDVPAYVQTIFGGKKNDEAVHVDGLSVLGDLTGPSLDAPITLFTAPGHQFVLPALHEAGEYTLQNIRLVDAAGKFLQQASPSFATIEVSAVFDTSVTVKQLSPDDLRARGITVDSRNYDVFQYSFSFTINNQLVTVPYTVVVDKRTHETIPQPMPNPYPLPPVVPNTPPPPRFQPPSTYPIMLDDDAEAVDVMNPPQFDIDKPIAEKPRIPAAIVIPTGFGVLHQFFAVILQVNNGAPQGSSIQLDNIRATLDAPLTLRVAKTTPSVSIGQAVPIYDSTTGTTFLIAMAKGSAEWSLEALKTGTHTVNIDVRATYKNSGQPDVPLHGSVSASLVVSDPRFHITFSHPDTIRKNEPYTAYAFVSNLSAQSQTVHLDTTDILACGQGYTSGVCRTSGTGITDLTLAPGEMSAVPYKLTPAIDGHIFAFAGDASDASIGVSVKLTMGVSATGIPLSPATLVMPYYARYLDPALVDAQLGILGLGYSLATAPLTAASAKFPRVIKSDVFQRAQDITRAGQRVFVAPADARDALDNLALDLLDNVERPSLLTSTTELAEWDQLRRQESDGRSASAALARQLEAKGLATGTSMKDFATAFAAATSHRSPYLFALVHGSSVSGAARPYALSLTGATTKSVLDVPSEAPSGWSRSLPNGELNTFTSSSEVGELALVGRWREDVQVSILPQSDRFSVELIYPDAASGFLSTSFDVTGAHAGTPVTFTVAKGSQTIVVSGGSAVPLVNHVSLTPLTVVGAAQDLHLDSAGHLVSILFNRPVSVTDTANLRDLFALTTRLDTKSYSSTRRNTVAVKYIPGAAVQDDATIVNVNFDKSLTKNSLITYNLAFDAINGEAGGTYGATTLVPRIDNDAPAGILFGHLLQADNTVVPQTAVELYSTNAQFDTTNDNGQFLFESVPKDIDNGINGNYLLTATAGGKTTSLHGSIRLLNTVEEVNLVFLGRGTAQGQLRYSDGTPIANQTVVVSSTIFGEFRSGTTGSDGRYNIPDVPVGPLTFIGRDQAGRFVYATNLIRAAGEVVSQDLVILLQDPPGSGSVHVTVRRSDVSDPTASLVPNAHVGVYARGFGLKDGYTDANGTFDFTGVPAGFISILASEFNITPQSAAMDVDLKADTVFNAALTLSVPTKTDQASTVTVQGTVTKDDPAAPNDTSKDTIVAGAVLQISGLASVTADAQGNFVYPNVPLSYGNGKKSMSVYDPVTQRRGTFPLPTLISGQTNTFSPRLQSSKPAGYATMDVRLIDARGAAVSGYRVVTPYYPPVTFTEKPATPGVYELTNVAAPVTYDVYAVPSDRTGPYGDQWAKGSITVSFDGQIGVAELHLPGQGTVNAGFQINGQNCDLGACASGPVNVSYLAWDEVEQGITAHTYRFDPDPNTGHVTITKIPALSNVTVTTIDNPAGYASASTRLAFDGDSKNVTLALNSLGDVTGRVLMPDVQTVVANASVRLDGSIASYLPVTTKADGTFKVAGVGANQPFRVTAEVTQDGIYRTGYVDARTPATGGPVSNLTLVLREQSTVGGQIVDGTGAPVPLARFWLRELAWPNRDFGTSSQPLTADKYGRFIINNVFSGAFRITAVDPNQQEIRGVYQGTIRYEADNSQTSVSVVIGSGGTGSITVTVVDPENNFAHVANADVTLVRKGADFDVASTDANGLATFDQVPADGTTKTYSLRAFSKAIGTAGSTDTFAVQQDQTTAQTITLAYRGTVSGVVQDPESVPLANAPVKGAAVSLRELGLWTRASTDGNGAFTFVGVPAGTFYVDAVDPDSGRATETESNIISQLYPEQKNITLTLARTAQLNVNVFLPDDGGNPGTLAPLADVTVNQSSDPPFFYTRELQGNNLTFVKMKASTSYLVTAREIGGEGRTVSVKGGFGGALTKNVSLTFPTSGTVSVKVLDGSNNAVSNALVTIRGVGKSATLYTDATGSVTISGFPLDSITVQATKGVVSASASGRLQSHSTPLSFTLNLGAATSVVGRVWAEGGTNTVPSAGTRVLLTATSRLLTSALSLETRTDATGHYEFDAIPDSGTNITIRALGPDDFTVGATITEAIDDGRTQPFPVTDLTLDATPPRVVSIDPANNANNVSPSSVVTVVFSEPIGPQFLSTNYFQLFSTDDGHQVSNAAVTGQAGSNGTYTVTITAPDPTAAQIAAGQKYRLKSNVVYTVAIKQGILDLAGNSMAATVGSSFTTVNYTEPAVISITPPVDQPLPQQTTFRVKFNKAIDITSLTPTNGGVVLEQLPSYKAVSGTALGITSVSADPADPATVVIAPAAPIAPSSFYRLTISGARDTQSPPNVQSAAKLFDYFSYDTIPPVISLNSPVPDGYNLISGVTYTFTPTILDQGTATPSTDIAYVDWLDKNGAAVFRAKTAPFSYTITAAGAPATLTLQALATDFSGNVSATTSRTWNVDPNLPPKNVALTLTPNQGYAGATPINADTSFDDEGVSATVNLQLEGTNADGSAYSKPAGSAHLTRSSVAAAWPHANLSFVVPSTLKAGTATVTATVIDSSSQSSTPVQAALTVDADTIPPVIVSLLPAAETHYQSGQTLAVQLKTSDAQTHIAKAVITIGTNAPVTINAVAGSNASYDSASGIWTFTTSITVPARNADTRTHITAVAYDNAGLSSSAATDVVYDKVTDPAIPDAMWVSPLDEAVLPLGQTNWQTTLRVRSSGNVVSVTFSGPALAAPVTVTTKKSGTTDIYETKQVLTLPADGTPTVLTATISDGIQAHEVDLPINVYGATVDTPVLSNDLAITASTAGSYAGKTILVRGPNAHLFIDAQTSVGKLIVVDGGLVSTPQMQKLELTVTDRLFVDADSTIDESAKGYLGAWQKRDDGVQNLSPRGMTLNDAPVGNTAIGTGALQSFGSYGGIGAHGFTTPTNPVYGSITNPVDFGSGGGGSTLCCTIGGNGGGALLLNASTATVALAGALRADGGNGYCGNPCTWGAGSGGSVSVMANKLITGWSSRITTNGGDDDSFANVADGAGGGRVAVRVTSRLDLDSTSRILQSRGGRNGTTQENNGAVDGGAGTVLLVRPTATNGELIVSSYDDRYPSSTHPVLGTPLTGTLTFDAITIGPRALPRFDSVPTLPNGVNISSDPTALVLMPDKVTTLSINSLTPVAGSLIPQGSSVSVNYSAGSDDGVLVVSMPFSGNSSAPAYTETDTYPKTITNQQKTVTVDASAPAGAATLHLIAETRSGRTATADAAFTVVANNPPAVQFSIDSGLVDSAALTMYANHTLGITVAASDDIAVTKLTFTATVTGQTPYTTSVTPSSPNVSQQFSFAVPPTSTGTVTLTVTAEDGISAHLVQASKTVTILGDNHPPTVTFNTPQPPYNVNDSAAPTLSVDVTATDAEVGVQHVTAVFDGVSYELTNGGANHWTKTIPVAHVYGTDTVQRLLSVTAYDYTNNPGAAGPLTINVIPTIDSQGPTVSWTCASPGALYPAGSTVTVSLFALSQSGADAQVQFSIDGGAFTNALADTAAHTWKTTLTIPAADAPGTQHTVAAVATATGGHQSSLLTTITVIGGSKISTATTITATDTTYENTSLYVASGATLTVNGAHHFANVAVLEGGTLIQTQADLQAPTTLTIDNFYVACTAIVHANSLGYAASTTYPGAGTPSDSSGGGHMGRGGLWPVAGSSANPGNVGGTFGSVYYPAEAGGGGQMSQTNFAGGIGGGIVKLAGTTVSIDGSVRANAQEATTWGLGAGGSVAITTSKLYGGGNVQARGSSWSGTNNRGGGGGGAIAVTYDSGSGAIFNNSSALGGTASANGTGAAGTVYLKKSSAQYGDLVVSNGTLGGTSTKTFTDLPAFGIASVKSVSSDGKAVLDAPWMGPYLVGNYVRVFAPEGGARGTWRIASITNDPTVRTINGVVALALQSTAYSGYLLYSEVGYASPGTTNSHIVAVRNNNGTWQYDNGTVFTTFVPAAGDKLFASFQKDTATITTMQTFTCDGQCPAVAGLPSLALVRGEVLMNATRVSNSCCPTDYPIAASNSFFLDQDADGHGLTLSGGSASVALEAAADVRAGDTLRGVYLFDHVTVTNARLYTPDLMDATPAVTNGTAVTGNTSAPVIDATKFTFVTGTYGPVIVGQQTAVTDTDAPLEVYGVNTARQINAPSFSASGPVTQGTRGGLSMRKIPNGKTCCVAGSQGLLVSAATATGYAYIQGRPSQTNKHMDLTIGEYDFAFWDYGKYNVWIGGSKIADAPYDPSMLFRIEKTPTTVRFLVDGKVVYTTTCDSSPRSFIAASWDDDGEINSIEYGTDPARFSTVAATDGSFALPVYGASGDPITITARDRHRYPLTSLSVSAGTIPASVTLTGLTLSSNPATGGQSLTGTVTLGSAAPTGGAIVFLASSSSVATVPASVTIAAGATSASFTISTQTVSSAQSAAITATYGDAPTTTTLSVNPVTVGVTFSANPAFGSRTITGTVTLSTALASSSTVTLSSSAPATASVPASVTVPAGQTSATFNITTVNPQSDTNAVITATLGGSQGAATLTVKPVSIASLQLNPTSLVAGQTSTGTVTLNQALPIDSTVTLTSNAPAAGVPANVTIPAGQTSVTFTVTTTNPQADVTATITAAFAGSQKTATLTVHANVVSVSVAPSIVTGGDTVAITVQLATPAATDAMVFLAWSPSIATFVGAPGFVTIPAGQSSVTFTEETLSPSVDVTGTLTATYGASQGTGTLTVRSLAITSFTASPQTVTGSSQVTFTVQFNNPVPSGNVSVTLTSSNTTALPVPASVVVLAGTTSKSFTATASSVSTSTSVTVTARQGGTSGSAVVTVVPGGSITASKISMTFAAGNQLTVTGAAGAVTGGLSPVTVDVADKLVPSTIYVQSVPVDASGAFSTTLPPSAVGRGLVVIAHDGSGQTIGPVDIGVAPAPVTINANAILQNKAGVINLVLQNGSIVGTNPIAVTVRNGRTGETLGLTLPTAGSLPQTVALTPIHAQIGDAISATASDALNSQASANLGTVPMAAAIDISKITAAFGTVSGTAGAVTGGNNLRVSIQINTNSYLFPVAADGSFSGSVTGTDGNSVIINEVDDNLGFSGTYGVTYIAVSHTVTITPSTARWDDSPTGTITLASALTHDATFNVTCSNPFVSIISRQTIPAGSTSVTFPVNYSNPPADTTAIVTATRSFATASATFTMKSVGVVLAVSPSAVVGGLPVNFTLTLDAPVKGSSVSIFLSSSDAAVGVLPFVTVDSGATSTTFTIVTNNPPADTTATITATYGRRQGSAVLAVTHAPGITLDASKIHLVLNPDGSPSVVGDAGAIGGATSPAFVDITDNTHPGDSTFFILSDASAAFSQLINAAQPGDSVSFSVHDSGNPTNFAGPIPLGIVPQPLVVVASDFLIHNDNGSIRVTQPLAPATYPTVYATWPLTLRVTDTRTGTTTAPVTVGSDFVFSIDVPGAAGGDALTVTATDAFGSTISDLAIGTVLPTPTTASVSITAAMADASFRARTLFVDGATRTLVAVSDSGVSNKIVLFDLTNPATPVYRSTIAVGTIPLSSVWVANGWIYAISDAAFSTIDLHTTPPTVHTAPDAPLSRSAAVTLLDGYAVAVGAVQDANYQFDVYTVSDPANPQLFSHNQQPDGTSSDPVTRILPVRPDTFFFGSTGTYGWLGRANTFQAIYYQGFAPAVAASIADDHFYVVGQGQIIDYILNERGNPIYNWSGYTPGMDDKAIDVAGKTAFIAKGADGISVVDLSGDIGPGLLGMYGLSGPAQDIKIANNTAYVASNGSIVALSNLGASPAIDKTLISVAGDGVATTTVTATQGAVTGQAPIAATLTTSSGGSAAGLGVAAGGSFGPTTVAGAPGATVTIAATDAAARTVTRNIGNVPFTIADDAFVLSPAITHDTKMSMRRMVIDGTHLYTATGYPWDVYGTSDEILAFDTTHPLAGQTPAVFHAAGESIENFVVSGGWAYVAGAKDLVTVNLTTGESHPVTGHSLFTRAVAVSGQYAFVASQTSADAPEILQVYDISNPASPAFVKEYPSLAAYAVYGIRAIGNNQLLVFDTAKVYVVNVADVSNITIVGSVGISDATDAAIDGNTLYVTGIYDGITIADITNRAAPTVLGFVYTLGPSIGVAPVSSSLVVVATGGSGLQFVDVSDRTNPVIKGTQAIAGSPQDVRVVGKTIYAASEGTLHALKLP